MMLSNQQQVIGVNLIEHHSQDEKVVSIGSYRGS